MRWYGLGMVAWFLLCSVAQARVREWTVLFYMAADEIDIKEQSQRSLKRIEKIAGLSADQDREISVVAQIDEPGEDPNYRYLLRYVPNPSSDRIDSPPVPESEVASVTPGFRYRELDSGNPLTLKEFLRWGVRAYPARHYVLILAGHSWGQQGLMQDFFVDGKELEKSTIIKNYELRRLLEETYRENTAAVSRGRFDALVIDACTSGQLDVLLEFEKSVDYLGASAIETPLTSFPYDKIFEPFVDSVTAGHAEIERDFLRPLVGEYIKAHAPGGELAAVEGMVDPVQYFVLRTSALGRVGEALKQLVESLPSSWREQWTKGELKTIEAVADGDENADLLMLGRTFERLSIPGSPQTARKARQLQKSLGYLRPNPSMTQTVFYHPRAVGAWAHLDLDASVSDWRLPACIALKSVATMNKLGNPEDLPLWFDKDMAVVVDRLMCDDLAKEAVHSELPVLVEGVPHPLGNIFGVRLEWPRGVPGYVTKEKRNEGETKLVLSLWVGAQGAVGLRKKIFLRTPGGTAVQVDYLLDKPVSYLHRRGEFSKWLLSSHRKSFAPYIIFDKPSQLGALYVAEGHSNGTHFKHGLGLFLGKELPTEDVYYQGWLPLDLIEPSPFAWTMEQYAMWAQERKAEGNERVYIRKGFDFYRLHRFQNLTRWADFLQGL